MPKLNMAFPYHFDQGEALRRIQKLLPEIKDEYANDVSGLRENWQGNTGQFSFKAKGFSVSGTLSVEPSSVKLVANLPFAASLIQGKIESRIKERAEKLLA